MREVEPSERIFEVPPDPFNAMQLRAGGGQEDQAHVRGEGKLRGCMCPTIVQRQEIEAVRERLREQVDNHLTVLGVQIRQLQEEAFARGERDGPIDIEPLEAMLHRPNRLHTAGARETGLPAGTEVARSTSRPPAA
jgi:hypothetical protein